MRFFSSLFLIILSTLIIRCEAKLEDKDLSSTLNSPHFTSSASEDITGSFRKGVLYTASFDLSASFIGVNNTYSLKITSNLDIDVIYDDVTYSGKDFRIQLSNSTVESGSLSIQLRPLEVGNYAVNIELQLFSNNEQQTLSSFSESFQVFANTDIDDLNLKFLKNKLFTSEINTNSVNNRCIFILEDDNPNNTYDIKLTYGPSLNFGLRALPYGNVIYPLAGFIFEGITSLKQSRMHFYLKPNNSITDLSTLHGSYNIKFTTTRESDGRSKVFDKVFQVIDDVLSITTESGSNLENSDLNIKRIMHERIKVHLFQDMPVGPEGDSIKLDFDTGIMALFNPDTKEELKSGIWYSTQNLKTSTINKRSLTEFDVVGKQIGETIFTATYKNVAETTIEASSSFNINIEQLSLSDAIEFTEIGSIDNTNTRRGIVSIFSGTPTMHNRMESWFKVVNLNTQLTARVSMTPRPDTPNIELRGDLMSNNIFNLNIGDDKSYSIVYTHPTYRVNSPNSFANLNSGCFYGSYEILIKNHTYNNFTKLFGQSASFGFCVRPYRPASINQNGITAMNDANGWVTGISLQRRTVSYVRQLVNWATQDYTNYHYYRVTGGLDNWHVSYSIPQTHYSTNVTRENVRSNGRGRAGVGTRYDTGWR